MSQVINSLIRDAKIEVPVICGAMYPCSNPELIAAVSEAGGMGIIQPMSLIYVHGYEFKKGLQKIRSLTKKPVGFNAVIEKSSKIYEDRMKQWIDLALEDGVRFFVTALGNPDWVVRKVESVGGVVYHDVTERKWALKALDSGVKGLICVNNRAGGHAGHKGPRELFDDLSNLGVPLVCAGGMSRPEDLSTALKMGYAGIQMGTRFIATKECTSHNSYKQAIINATENDIVKTERVTGVPLSVIKTPYVEKVGLKVGPLAKFLFKNRKTKHWIRTYYNAIALWSLKKSSKKGLSSKDYWQAGKSVEGVDSIEPAGDIVKKFQQAFLTSKG